MNWLSPGSHFPGGVFAANAIPRFVADPTGRASQTPFARFPAGNPSTRA